MKNALYLVVFALAAATFAALLPHAGLASSKPPRLPSFTADQANRGRLEFYENCAECHGAQSQGKYGPALVGPDGNLQWETLQYVYGYETSQMPAGNAGGLSQKVYLDITAYLLQSHGNRPGSKPLTANVASTSQALIEPGP